jgi:hypothetical protein
MNRLKPCTWPWWQFHWRVFRTSPQAEAVNAALISKNLLVAIFFINNWHFMKRKVNTKLSTLCVYFLFWCYVYLNSFVISFTECPLNIATSSEVMFPFYLHMLHALCLEVRCTEYLFSITDEIVHIIYNIWIIFFHIHNY